MHVGQDFCLILHSDAENSDLKKPFGPSKSEIYNKLWDTGNRKGRKVLSPDQVEIFSNLGQGFGCVLASDASRGCAGNDVKPPRFVNIYTCTEHCETNDPSLPNILPPYKNQKGSRIWRVLNPQ